MMEFSLDVNQTKPGAICLVIPFGVNLQGCLCGTEVTVLSPDR